MRSSKERNRPVTDVQSIHIVSIVGSGVCVASEDGEKVFQQILKALERGKKAEISFHGVEDLTSLFVNTAIGQLYTKFSEEYLKSRLSVVHASPQDLGTLKRSIDRAKEYQKDPDRFHSATKEALGEDHE